MLPALTIGLCLGLSPSMAGPPVASASSSTVTDYAQSIFLTGPASGSQCTNAAVTTDQAGAITVSRASTSYCQKQDGTYVLIDNNKLVVEPDGLRVEPASTNRVANSVDLNGGWTLNNMAQSGTFTDPFGGTTAQKFNTSVAGGFATSAAFTITGTDAVLSAWTKSTDPSTDGTLVLRDGSSGTDMCTITITHGTGFQSTQTGRASCSSSSIVSGHNHTVRFFPGGAGSAVNVSVFGVQVEPGRTVMTSYVPTSGTAVTRAADVVTIATDDISSAGCVGATMKGLTPGFPQRLFTRASDTAAFNGTASIFANDGTNTVNSPNVSNMTGRSVPMRVQWGGSALRVDLDSSTGTPGSFDGSMGSGTTLYLGSNAGVQQFQGWLKAIKVSTSTAGCTP